MNHKTRISRRLATLALGGAALALSFGAQAANIQERTLKLGHVHPADSNIGVGAQKFAELVSQKSGGKMTVKLYHNGTLGGEVAQLSSLQGGILELSVAGTAVLAGNVKEQAIWDFPFLFANGREADFVLDGPVGQQMFAKLNDKGLVGLAYWDHGFRNVTNTRRPITRLEDFSGIKLRVPQVPFYIDAFRALGANAVPVPFPELYSALDSKTVDGQEQPNTSILSNRFYEVQKYLSVTRHIYTPLALLMSKKVWDQYSADEKAVVESAAREAAVFQRAASRAMDEKALATLKTNGLIVNELTPQETARLKEAIRPVVEKYAKTIGEQLLQELNAELAKFRAQK